VGAPADEVTALLTRLCDAETDPRAKSAALVELADVRRAAGDAPAVERALIEALALAPSPALLARAMDLHGGNTAEQARVLAATVVRAEALQRPDASCLAALGQLEVDALARAAEGVGHLRSAVALAPAMHEARAALARGLVQLGASAEALSVLASMMIPDATPLVSVRDLGATLAALERALALEGRRDEAIVARELRAVAGTLDDGAHVELRARRLPIDHTAPIPALFDRAALRGSFVPAEAQNVLLDVAAAIAGAEGKLTRAELEELGLTRRDALSPAGGHPLALQVHRLARALAIAPPDLAVSGRVTHARVVIVQGAPWIIAPESLMTRPEPVQMAAIARAMTRIALSLPWLDELPSQYAHAVLCGAARQAIPDYAMELKGDAQQELIDEYAKRVARGIGRKQKKMLAELAPALSSQRAPTVADVDAFTRGIARAELRVAFVVTGDLLAVLDEVRTSDAALAKAAGNASSSALAATLAHPLAGDVARFALNPAATTLRWRAGTLWARA
jgi:hypothetical protein